MKRLKRALSLTKSTPRIEELEEIDEHTITKDLHLGPLHEHPVNGEIKNSCNGNNNSSTTNKGIYIRYKYFMVFTYFGKLLGEVLSLMVYQGLIICRECRFLY